MQWLEPWTSAENFGQQVAEGLCLQLQKEVPPGHMLFGVPVRMLAQGNGDDVLFQLEDGTGRVARVHLSWSKSQEVLPWPRTEVFPSLDAWAERVMVPEHDEWST